MSLLRLDRLSHLAPGNKLFKLHNLSECAAGYDAVLSFGGAWSNHLHALAATGQALGIATVGVIRGERPARLSAMLEDAQNWGMRLLFVSRTQYRQRHDPHWQQALASSFGRCLVLPEGGASIDGVRGCKGIAALLEPHLHSGDTLMLAVGTGATLAGVIAGLSERRQRGDDVTIEGVSVLKGIGDDTAQAVQHWLTQLALAEQHSTLNWTVREDAHEGGYARVSAELKRFIQAFEDVHQVPLEPVYTGKLLFRIYRDLAAGRSQARIIAIHTGGLQGRRGFPWLTACDALPIR